MNPTTTLLAALTFAITATAAPEDTLVSDASDARQLWQSDDPDLGYAKGSVSGYLSNLARWPGHPGSASGPVLHDGTLYVTTFRPAGETWAEKQHGLEKILDPNAKKPLTEEQRARLHANLRILADDLLVAIDAATGKTIWKAVEPLAGLNRYMGKRQGYMVSPAVHGDTVFSLGTSGLLRAYRATDGKKLWEKPIGTAHDKALEHKTKMLERQTLPGGMGWDSSLVAAGDTLVVPLFDGAPDHGLRGIDPSTGDTRWEIEKACSRHATPALWTHGGKAYILTATVSGELHLIDPNKGTKLWSVDGLGQNHFTLTPAAGYVLVNGGSETPRKPGDSRLYGLLACYSISPAGAERRWKHPEDPRLYLPTWMDSCARRFLSFAGDHIAYYARGLDKTQQHLMLLDPADGSIVDALPLNTPAPLFFPAGDDKLLTLRDGSHSDTELAMISYRGGKLERLTDDFWSPPHLQTTAYEVLMENPYDSGRLYLRTQDGRIAAYDFSAENTKL